jgi:RNA polymerase sigma factor (sigma-70 family)
MIIWVKIFIFFFRHHRAYHKIKACSLNGIAMGKYYIWNFICILQKLFKNISDRSIIEGIRRQEDKALNWLYDNYFQSVSKHILNNSGTPDDVSDIFQDTVIILYSQIKEKTLNLETDLKGYFFGIARNCWKEHLRARRVTTSLDFNLPDDSPADEPGELLLERIVSRAFHKLKPEFQTVLKMYTEGCSYDEIAGKLSLKNETYARRKKYLSKEALMELVKADPEFQEYLRFQK